MLAQLCWDKNSPEVEELFIDRQLCSAVSAGHET